MNDAGEGRSGGVMLIGVVHLAPMPGSSGWLRSGAREMDADAGPAMEPVIEAAVRDASAYAEGGCDAVFLENFGDAPFTGGVVGPETVAAMAVVGRRVRREMDVPVGFNVLRNDAAAALALCAACGGEFIRVNVHTGGMMTDQGLIEGKAYETLRLRERICPAGVKIFADVLVKHAAPLGPVAIGAAAKDTLERGKADGVIVSGHATGAAVEMDDLRRVREACPEAFVLVGSGVTEESVGVLSGLADGLIVGTSLKVDGVTTNPVDRERVRSLKSKLQNPNSK